MKISNPIDTPIAKKLTPGRPPSRTLVAIGKLAPGQALTVTFKPGTSPTIETVRSQVSGWASRLGFKLSHRTNKKSRLTIHRI